MQDDLELMAKRLRKESDRTLPSREISKQAIKVIVGTSKGPTPQESVSGDGQAKSANPSHTTGSVDSGKS